LYGSCLPDQRRIPCFRHADYLAERGCGNTPPDILRPADEPMQPFGIARVRNTESRYTGIRIEARQLLFESHERQNAVDSLVQREIGILKREYILRTQRHCHKRSEQR
jgi:hypothetical protein